MSAITKRDATALWHAVDALRAQYRAMKDMPDMQQHLPAAQLELSRAGVALRKVQAEARANSKPWRLPASLTKG